LDKGGGQLVEGMVFEALAQKRCYGRRKWLKVEGVFSQGKNLISRTKREEGKGSLPSAMRGRRG